MNQKRLVLSGNEAIARGAFESGVKVASAYPGTPSTEILENLARLIRERFKLNGHVRVLSSQARLSAYILVAVPFITAFVIHLMNPKFFNALLENPSGKYVLGAGVVWMIIGIFFMKRIVTIRV